LIWLVLTFFFLLGYSLQSAAGSAYYSLLMQDYATVTSPPVILEEGTAGNSTIYTNRTSAKVGVSAPLTTYFPTSANETTGTYMSGTMTSLRSVDGDRYVVRSAGSATSASAYYPSGNSTLGSTSWISGLISNLTSDDGYMVFRSYGTGTAATGYNPSGYDLLGSTTLVDGTESNLTANDESYMIFRSYATGNSSTEYAHLETQVLGSNTYYTLKVDSANSTGMTLPADGSAAGRVLFGKFIYPLVGVSSIPAETWTIYYRAIKDSAALGAHCDVEIVIRQANDTIRQTIATDVANSAEISTSYSTLSGTYSWSEYTVVNQTDYLEIDFYAHITGAKAGQSAYLRIDDSGLPLADQTRADTTVPADFVSDVEFIGTSNLYTWTSQIAWSVDSSWTVGSVSVTMQVYNYTLGDYPTSGEGYYFYTSSTSADTDENVTRTITVNPQDFRNATGYWKMKIKGEKGSTVQFDFNADWIEFKPTYYNEWTSEVEFSGTSNMYTWAQLNWTVDSAWTVGSVSVTLQLYNYTLGDYPTSGNGYKAYTSSPSNNTDETKILNITTNPEDFRNATDGWKIKIKGVANTTAQFDFKADWIEYKPTYYSEYKVETEFVFSDITSYELILLNFTVVSQYNVGSVEVTIQVYNYSSSSYVTGGEGYLPYNSSATENTDETKILNITTNIEDYVSSGNAKIKVTGTKTTTTQLQQKTNQVKLDFDQAIATSDHYPSTYTNSTGTYMSGNVPSSVKTVDSDYFVVRSSGAATSTSTYNPGGYSLVDDTLFSSGAIGDVSSSNDSYMVFTAYNDTFYKTAVSESESTTFSTSWQDKAVLTWDVPIADDYLVYATAEITEGDTSKYVGASLTIDGTSYGETRRTPYNTENYETFSAVKITSLTAASHTMKIQYRTEVGGSEAKIKNARIIAMRIGSYYQSTEVASGSRSGTTYQDAATLTWTPSSSGNWLIITNLETYNSAPVRLCYANLLVDGVQYDEGIVKMVASSDRLPQGTHKVANLDATSHTLKIQVKSSGPTTVYYRNVRLYAIDLDSVGSTYETDIGEAESTYSTDTTYQTKANLTWTLSFAANYLIIATADIASNSTSVAVKAIMQIDSTTYGNSTFYPEDVGIYETFKTSLLSRISAIHNQRRIHRKLQHLRRLGPTQLDMRNTI